MNTDEDNVGKSVLWGGFVLYHPQNIMQLILQNPHTLVSKGSS